MSSGEVGVTGGHDLENIHDEELLKTMWQSAEDFGERRRIRARMYRLREQRLREMVQNDEESMGALEVDGCDDNEGNEVIKIETTRSSNQTIKEKLNSESESKDLLSVTENLSGNDYNSMKNKETRDSVSPSQCKNIEIDMEEDADLLAERDRIVEALQKAGKTVKVVKSEGSTRKYGKSGPSQNRSSTMTTTTVRSGPMRTTTTSTTTSTEKEDADDEFSSLRSYFRSADKASDVLVNQNEEEMYDESGNKVQMFTRTTKDKDGKEFTTKRTAKTTKIVDNVDDIDEILIGNPDHEIVDREVSEEEDKDGNKLKIIRETRRRPDGIEYTTKNVLKTSKIFDYDHPEDINHCDSDEIVSMTESEETDENGVTIRTVNETRRKSDGTEYVTKKVYKTSKVSAAIAPSDDDEVIATEESEEKDSEGNTVKVIIETRRKATGEEYTYRQVFKCRRMTLTGVGLQEGMPMMNNDDEVLDKKEKKEKDENGAIITVVTETRRRKDGTKYTFDYILRSFQGSKSDVSSKMPTKSAGSSNIKVSEDDELIREEVKEEEQKDGSVVKTIQERRRTKDGTEYLRQRVMRIPKIQEPKLTVGTASDEVLTNDVEEVEYNGTRIKSVTERRRSSITGLQYTLRRMSKTYQQTRRPSTVPGDEIVDENVTEEEGEDGTVVKTIIRRFQKADGTMYTTHSVKKMFTSATEVDVSDYCEGELLDQTIDQAETNDGCIITTVTETYQKTNGVTYTVERSEKIEKNQMSQYDQKSLITPKSNDIVLTQDIEEEPDNEGHVIKITTEDRKRSDGSMYTIKSTIAITPTLIPEEETSFVVIKPDDGKESDYQPSMDDELVYTRKREETDPEGNPITVIIETRKSKKTGEKYNVTKRVFTTDVIMTNEGEKVLTKKTKTPTSSSPSRSKPESRSAPSKTSPVTNSSAPRTKPVTSSAPAAPKTKTVTSPVEPKTKPVSKVSSIKEKFTSPKSDTKPRDKQPRLIRVNTSDRKKIFEPDSKTTTTSRTRDTDKKTTLSSRTERVDSKSNVRDSTTRVKSTLTTSLNARKPTDSKQPLSPRTNGVNKEPLNSRPSSDQIKTSPSKKMPLEERKSAPKKKTTATPSSTPARPSSGRATPTSRTPVKESKDTPTNRRTREDRPQPTQNGVKKTSPNAKTTAPRSRNLDLNTTKSPVVSMPATPMVEEKTSFPNEVLEEIPAKQEDILATLETYSRNQEPKEVEEEAKKKKANPYEGMTPVTEPFIVPRHFHRLGSDEEEDSPKEKKPLDSVPEKSAPRLIKKLNSQDDDSTDSPSRKRPSGTSKQGSPSPDRSTRGDSPFTKEDSPGKFATGRPVDQGVNSNKIKKLERSLSGKVTYDDLAEKKDNLPTYLENLENITELSVLEKMLEEASAYEERRVIRSRIRVVKRDQPARVTSSTNRYNGSTFRGIERKTLSSTPSTGTKSTRPADKSTRPVEKSTRPADKSTRPTERRRSPTRSSPDRPDESTPSTDRTTSLFTTSRNTSVLNKSKFSTSETTSKTTSTISRKQSDDDMVSKTYRSTTKSSPLTKKNDVDMTSKSTRRDSVEDKPRKLSSGKKPYRRQESKELSKPKDVKDPASDPKEPKEPAYRSRTTKEPTTKPKESSPRKMSGEKEQLKSEPLRHQRQPGSKKGPTAAPLQTQVDKIVSPYGVGPTDENGMPLFGLRALRKKRNGTATEAPVDAPVETPKSKPFEPTDSSGKPLFGLRSLRSARTEQETTVTSSTSTRKSSVRSTTSSKSSVRSDAESSDEGSVSSSDTEVDMKGDDGETTKEEISGSEEVISTRTKPLKDIIKLHETIVNEPKEVKSTSVSTPKLKLRQSFEPTPERDEPKTVHKTWDVDSDLATRAVNMKTIITRHESIGKDQDEETVTSTSNIKLSTILKKTDDKETTSESKDFMDDMTEEQITELSEEFDRKFDSKDSKTTYSDIKLTSHKKEEPKSFLNSRSKVSGMQDVVNRMAVGADASQSDADTQALSTLNRFLGAQVLLTGVESMMGNGAPKGGSNGRGFGGFETTKTVTTSSSTGKVTDDTVKGVSLNSVTDRATLQNLLDSCEDYEDRRKVRLRLKNLSASAKGGSGVNSSTVGGGDQSYTSSARTELRTNQDLNTVNTWLSENFPEHSAKNTGPKQVTSNFSKSSYSSETSSKVSSSPFNKFQQLDSQFQTTRRASGAGAANPSKGQLFSLSSSLKSSANSIKDVMLQWCQARTRGYEGVKIDNFSTSWNDGMAFCALIHHFYPDAFDFDKLSPKNRRYNFNLAFNTADNRAGVMALLDVDDMVAMKKPDWKCVFTYVQSLYRRLKDE